jgi:hypothetical protein
MKQVKEMAVSGITLAWIDGCGTFSLIFSHDEVYTTAGIDSDALPQTEIAIRGRNEPIRVRTAADATTLSGLQQVSGTMKGESPVDQAVA